MEQFKNYLINQKCLSEDFMASKIMIEKLRHCFDKNIIMNLCSIYDKNKFSREECVLQSKYNLSVFSDFCHDFK